MADNDGVPEADAFEQALPPNDADPELIDVDDDPEIGLEVSEADAMEQSRARAVPAAVSAKPMPLDAPVIKGETTVKVVTADGETFEGAATVVAIGPGLGTGMYVQHNNEAK